MTLGRHIMATHHRRVPPALTIALALVLAACTAAPATQPTQTVAATATGYRAVEPTEQATVEPTDDTTGSGGAGSGGNGGASAEIPFPTIEEHDLLSHVPEGFRDTCERPESAVAPGDPAADPRIIASVECAPDDGPTEVGFTQYASTDAMDQAFDQAVAFFELSEVGCVGEESGYGPYEIDGVTVGRVLCSQQALGETGTVMHWTDERLDIKAYAASEDPDLAALYEWWTGDSGPVE